jgi:hypothetical protein
VDITVRAAPDALQNQHQGRQDEIPPFFAHLILGSWGYPGTLFPRALKQILKEVNLKGQSVNLEGKRQT